MSLPLCNTGQAPWSLFSPYGNFTGASQSAICGSTWACSQVNGNTTYFSLNCLPADLAPATTTTAVGTTTAATTSSISLSPFDMDIPTATAIGGSLLLVMAVSWVIRQAINFLQFESKDES